MIIALWKGEKIVEVVNIFSRSARKSMAKTSNVSSVSHRRVWCWENNVDSIFI